MKLYTLKPFVILFLCPFQDRPIRLSVLEYHKKSRNVLIGLSETTVRAILNTQRDFNADEIERDQSINGFILQRGTDNMKRVGRLYVKLAQVIDNTYGEDISESICTDNGDDNSSRHGSVGNFDSPSTPRSMSFRDVTDPYAIDIAAIPAPVAAPATFQDYVQDGCQLDFCVAIDFTSSNGKYSMLKGPQLARVYNDLNPSKPSTPPAGSPFSFLIFRRPAYPGLTARPERR